MLSPTDTISADDVCVRCKVRKSETASNLDFGPMMEMICTMRHWDNKPKSKSDQVEMGPEIILKFVAMLSSTDAMGNIKTERYRSPSPASLRKCSSQQSRETSDSETSIKLNINRSKSPLPMYPRERSGSFGSNRNRSRPNSRRRGMLPPSRTAAISAAFAVDSDSQASETNSNVAISYTIKMKDIVRVDLESSAKDQNPTVEGFLLYIISHNCGCVELNFHSKNSLDVVQAFLSANISEDRIASKIKQRTTTETEIPTLQKQASSIDMENFQAKEFNSCFQNESFRSRFHRRISLFMTRFTDVTFALSDCICGAQMAEVQGKRSNHEIYDDQGKLELQDVSKNDSFEKCFNKSSNSETVSDVSKQSPPKTITLQDCNTEVPRLEMYDGERLLPPKPDKQCNSAGSELLTVSTTKSTLDDQLSGTNSHQSIDVNNNSKVTNTVDLTPDKIDGPQSPPLVTVDI